MADFATMKKLPRQRTLTEEVEGYIKCKRYANTAASLTSKYRSLSLTSITSLTVHHLLSLKPDDSLTKLSSGFGFKAMPPRQEVPPVYMEVA
jgi:hypothetical protein